MLVEQKAERVDLQRQIDAERNSKEAIRARMDRMQASMQGQIEAERRDKERLPGRVDRCEADMHELSNRTCAIGRRGCQPCEGRDRLARRAHGAG